VQAFETINLCILNDLGLLPNQSPHISFGKQAIKFLDKTLLLQLMHFHFFSLLKVQICNVMLS